MQACYQSEMLHCAHTDIHYTQPHSITHSTVCTRMLLPITSKSVAMVAMVGINQVSYSFVSFLPACFPLLPLRFPWVLQVSSLHLLSTFIDKTTLVVYVVLHSSRFGVGGVAWIIYFPFPTLTLPLYSPHYLPVLISLCVIYFFVAVFTWLSPPITGLIGEKVSLVICGFLYW